MGEEINHNKKPNLSIEYPRAIFLVSCIRENKIFEADGCKLGLEFLLREVKGTTRNANFLKIATQKLIGTNY